MTIKESQEPMKKSESESVYIGEAKVAVTSDLPRWMRYFSVVGAVASLVLTVACFGFGAYLLFIGGTRPIGGIIIGIGAFACLVFALFLTGLRCRNTQDGRNMVTGLIVAGVSTLIALGLAELLLALFHPALTFDRAVEYSPGIFQPSTTLPFQLRPGYKHTTYIWELDREVDVTINSHGFRCNEFSLKKPPGTYRIILLGDSFGINLGIDDDDVHTARLERMLNGDFGEHCRYEVINGSYAAGFSPDSYVAFMLQQGFDLDPDLVIMQYFVRNDFKDLLEIEVVESRDGMPYIVRSKSRHVGKDGRYRRNISFEYKLPILRNSHLYVTLYSALKLERVLQRLAAGLITDYNADNFNPNSLGIQYYDVYRKAEERPVALQQKFEESMEYIRRIDRECKRRGVDFVLFVVPTGLQVARDICPEEFADDWNNPNPQKQILEALKGDGVKILSPLEFFRESLTEGPLYAGVDRDGHWTTAGNRVAAEAMFDYLVQNVDIKALPEGCKPEDTGR